jgi:hypothetical protein
MLARAIRKLRVVKRQETHTAGSVEEGKWVRFVNSPREYAGCKFGVLTLYSPGTHHLVIDLKHDEERDELDVSKYPPPAGKQFTEPTLFFVVRDNHVVLIQSKSLRVQDLENHLNWLLAAAGCIDEKQRVFLTDAIPAQTKKKLVKAPIKRISMGVPLVNTAASEISPGRQAAAAVNRFAKGIGIDMLKGILSDKEFASIKLNELTEVPDIHVSLEIKVVGHRRDTAADDKVMKKIMNELRHVEDTSFLKVDLKGGGKLDGSSLRVQDYKNVDSFDGVIDVSDAYEVMRKWLELIIDAGEVEAN